MQNEDPFAITDEFVSHHMSKSNKKSSNNIEGGRYQNQGSSEQRDNK